MSIRIKCPKCSRTVNAAIKYAGKTVHCPGCKSKVVIPAPESKPNNFDETIASSAASIEPTHLETPHVRLSKTEAIDNNVRVVGIKIPLGDAFSIVLTFWIASILVCGFLFGLWVAVMIVANSLLGD